MLSFLSQPQIWTNFVYLFPILIAISHSFILEAVVLVVAMVVSIVYHSLEPVVHLQWFFLRHNVSTFEYIMGVLDYLSGFVVAIIFVRHLVYSHISIHVLVPLLLLFIAGFIIYMGPNYFPFLSKWSVTTTHSIWHVISAIVAAIILLQ